MPVRTFGLSWSILPLVPPVTMEVFGQDDLAVAHLELRLAEQAVADSCLRDPAPV
jgi:hypothetical protein